ncbi:CU044_5270 family protein [Micromonospora siamensis]|uniref:CU044_5270 family protein n=1 Tax=Micromonospora siamensis TaxID=299152 RepID=A0A1C5H298_9ACTN|nr:CU044_5270 family protein [Micromonospora siamensis]SCG40043.1 hypothetical protein GA0074704_0913 [Micromonospora siamensis]
MNDLTTLAELGATLDPPTGTPPARLRHRVLTQATRPSRRTARITRPRLGWRTAAVGGLAAALTVGVLATQVVSFGDRAPVSTASAAGRILAGAADEARHRPALDVRDNQFVYVRSLTTAAAFSPRGAAGAQALDRTVWLSADGTRDGLIRNRPRTGAGATEEIPLPGCRDGVAIQHKYGRTERASCTATPGHRAGLPTSADEMLAYLRRAGAGTRNPPDQQAFTAAGDLVREAYLPPESLAAVFEAVGEIPGVTVVGDVTDQAGRAGVALALTEVQGYRTELIFDRASHAYLGSRQVLVRDQDGLKAGDVLDSTAVLTVGVVDQVGQRP